MRESRQKAPQSAQRGKLATGFLRELLELFILTSLAKQAGFSKGDGKGKEAQFRISLKNRKWGTLKFCSPSKLPVSSFTWSYIMHH